MPVMIGRGDSPGHGTSAVGEDADAAGVKHGPVRDEKEPERRRRFSAARTAGRVFAAVTLLPALLAVAWLVPEAGLLLAGRLLAVPMVIVSGTLAVAVCYFAVRRLPASRQEKRAGRVATLRSGQPETATGANPQPCRQLSRTPGRGGRRSGLRLGPW